jgi:secondary thiamine-phosphate synthase enzyme
MAGGAGPFDPSPQRYQHNRTGEDNADAHLKRQVMGREVVVAITKGKLDFGPWEQIFYGEFDGNRPKRVLVKAIGELTAERQAGKFSKWLDSRASGD